MKSRNELAKIFTSALLLLLTDGPAGALSGGFSVNHGIPQTGAVVGAASVADLVNGSGTFAGAYFENFNNTSQDTVYVSTNASIVSPGTQPFRTNITTQTIGTSVYTNRYAHQALISIGQGQITNYGTLTYSNSALPSTTFLSLFDGYVADFPDPETNLNYFFGDGVYADAGNSFYWGPISLVNGSPGNPNASISALVNGNGQGRADGIYTYALYGDSTNTDTTVLNYGSISGVFQSSSFDGEAAGMYNYSLYGGMALTNFSGGSCSATAPFYTTAIFAQAYYGSINAVNAGSATAASTGGNFGATANQAYAVGMDLFTYEGDLELLNTGLVTGTSRGATTNFCYGIFEWAQGGSMTLNNSGTVAATSSSASEGGADGIYCGGNGGAVSVVNTGSIEGFAGGKGGWALGVENDENDPVTVVNSGAISHNNGLGLALFAGSGSATISNLADAVIHGGLEGIAAENYPGNITIYDYGSIRAGNAYYNAMDLGPGNDMVHLYGLPVIIGLMNGQGGTNMLDFELAGALQTVNGVNATKGDDISAYNLGTSGNIVVSGQSYKWANFNVSGFVAASPIEAWRYQYFGTTANTGNAADNADPDHDGVPNLLEYAYGLNPTNANSKAGLNTSVISNRFTITLPRNTAAADITITLQSADSLKGTWTALASSVAGAPFSPSITGSAASESGTGITRMVTVTDAYLTTNPAHSSRFFRIVVQD
jgi:hypothetical protein